MTVAGGPCPLPVARCPLVRPLARPVGGPSLDRCSHLALTHLQFSQTLLTMPPIWNPGGKLFLHSCAIERGRLIGSYALGKVPPPFLWPGNAPTVEKVPHVFACMYVDGAAGGGGSISLVFDGAGSLKGTSELSGRSLCIFSTGNVSYSTPPPIFL